jgi:hypothetical protein
MSERLFLEDVGTPFSITPIGHGKAWEVRKLKKDSPLPPLLYVIESQIGEEFLLGRGISGRPKFNMLRYIANLFVDLFFEQLREKNCYQYLILRGAYPFDLQYGFGHTAPYDRFLLPTGFIKLQRILNHRGDDWEIEEGNFIGKFDGETWLIPDPVVASGSTVSYFLRKGFAHHLPKQVYLFTACGSLEGIQRIYQECLKHHVGFIPVFSQCLFEVSKVGNLPHRPLTDLSIINPGSITTKRFFEKAYHRYQGKRMCCVGDIGECLEDPFTYSLHTLWEMQILGMDPKKEDWEAWTIDIREKDFQKKIKEFRPSLFDYLREIFPEDS